MAELLIDAANCIFGRLASKAAKLALEGNRVIIINAEKCIISGDKRWIIEHFKERSWRKVRAKGEFERRPDRLLRRAMRKMLPYKEEKGRKAYARIKVFIGVPEKYRGREAITIEEAKVEKRKIAKYITLAELSCALGARW